MLRFIRFEHWFTQKLSPLLTVSYALLWATDVAPQDALAVLPWTLLALCSVAAYGHVVNDCFDIESDALAGKPNALADVAPATRGVLALSLLGCGFGFLWLAHPPSHVAWLLALNYLLPTIYSAPPVRLKHRALAGVACDAAAAHLIPAVFVALALYRAAGLTTSSHWLELTVSACVWSTCLGLRGILIHQALDRQGDLAAGLNTFAAQRSKQVIRNLVVRAILPIEGLGAAAFVFFLPSYPAPLIAALAIFLAGEASRVGRGLRTPMVYLDQPNRERYVPLVSNELYEVWLPCALVLQLAIVDPRYLPLPFLHFLLFRQPILRTAGMIVRLLARTLRLG